MSSTRKALLAALEALGGDIPEMRFGQLVCFVAHLVRGPAQSAVYDVEDQELIEAIEKNREWRRSQRKEEQTAASESQG
jgi:hypothetical protein